MNTLKSLPVFFSFMHSVRMASLASHKSSLRLRFQLLKFIFFSFHCFFLQNSGIFLLMKRMITGIVTSFLLFFKFEQASDQGLWPDYVTKITLFGFLAIFRGLVWASDRKFWKNSPNMQGYFSRVPKNTDRGKFEQNSDWGACPNYVTKMLKKCSFLFKNI